MGIRSIIGKDTYVRTTYRRAKRSYYHWRENIFLRYDLSRLFHFGCDYDSSPPLLLVTIAYNRADVIQQQLRLLSKYLSDPFIHIVVDNSRHKPARKKIAHLCHKYDVGYVSLPNNFYQHESSSHGLALNWAYQHLANAINPHWIGFLDHDIFPIREHSILKHLECQFFYGQKDQREDIWYLWPGFSFYQTSWLRSVSVDFKPGVVNGTMVDTGGLIPLAASALVKESSFVESYQSNVQPGNVPHQHRIEWLKIDGIDTWFHCIGASYWIDARAKEEFVRKTLQAY